MVVPLICKTCVCVCVVCSYQEASVCISVRHNTSKGSAICMWWQLLSSSVVFIVLLVVLPVSVAGHVCK